MTVIDFKIWDSKT